jgi:predicted nucleic acid-binding protein
LEFSQTAIDASFLLKLFLPEERSEKVHALWSSWIEGSVEVVAPTLIIFESASVIRNKLHRKLLNKTDAAEIIKCMKRMDMTLVYTDELLEGAWEIGQLLELPVLYDCFYLALAQLLNAPLWTADEKLYHRAQNLKIGLNLVS